MVEGPFFIEKFGGSWVFKPHGDGETRARFRYSLKMKKWTIPYISEFLASLYFKRIVVARLNGLKKYCENKQNMSAL